MADVLERPHKKRRFFVDDTDNDADSCKPTVVSDAEPTLPDFLPEPPATAAGSAALPENDDHDDQNSVFQSVHARDVATASPELLPQPVSTAVASRPDVFDAELLKAVAGSHVPDSAIRSLQGRYGDDLEGAMNAYFDGSWKTPSPQKPAHNTTSHPVIPFRKEESSRGGGTGHETDLTHASPSITTTVSAKSASSPDLLDARLDKRYIGALGVAGWTTRSGVNLLKPGDVVTIERTKQQTSQKTGRGGGKAKPIIRKTQDVIVRFTNIQGEEVGRLEKDTAVWISVLLDQHLCSFEAHCVFAPERVRVNDTVYLQLRCFLLRQAFEASNFIKPLENNRETGIFEAQETSDERDLRIRQFGLVKLFSEIGLLPSKANEMTAKHKRDGILQAAEVAEQYDRKEAAPTTSASSPPSDEQEDGEELEQDQLDSLYKKAQSFDFNTPIAEPASTFAMDLRKYQKQALHWMLNKESSKQDAHREQSMHPLWEEYLWPTKDAEDKPLPAVAAQHAFYLNPYSGELSLDFPVQEQNCLGGILADEMGLGKTIEMLALIHSSLSPEQQQQQEANSAASTTINAVSALSRLPLHASAIERAPTTTLVVAPMSLLAQWASEAAKASHPGSLRVLTYYGADKSIDLRALCSAANANAAAAAPLLIITSYGVVLSEYNTFAAAAAASDPNSNSSSTNSRSSQHSPGLFSLSYHRLILDEAHFIKNRSSKTAKACYALLATHRWTLTGTPIVNRLEDLFSLVRFLRVEPWSNFSFWKTFITVPFEKGAVVRALDVVQTLLEPLVLRRTKDMKTPSGEALVPLPPRVIEIMKVQLSKPEREVYDFIYARAKRTFAGAVSDGSLMKSYTTIFAQILRLRQCCCHPVLTRNKNVVEEEEEVRGREDEIKGFANEMDLEGLLARFEADTQMSASGLDDKSGGGAAHGAGDGVQDVAAKFGKQVLEQIRAQEGTECPICSEEPMVEQAVVAGCWHSACKVCLMDYIEREIEKGEVARCFSCREAIGIRDVFEVVREDDHGYGGEGLEDEKEGQDHDDDDDEEVVELQGGVPAEGQQEEDEEEEGQAAAAITSAMDMDSADIDHDNEHERDSEEDLYASSQPPRNGFQRPRYAHNNHHTPRISLRRVTQLSSAKLRVLLSQLLTLRRQDPTCKSVIFSQFTSFLSLLTPALQHHNIHTLRFDGSLSQKERARVLAAFAAAPKFTVLLLSLRAGGVGLNLTCARRVWMLDPWWSWAVEAQAIDRVHRMGQTAEVKVVRLVVQGSIEEKMLIVQERKKFIASSLGMMSEEEKKAQRIEDIRELLS